MKKDGFGKSTGTSFGPLMAFNWLKMEADEYHKSLSRTMKPHKQTQLTSVLVIYGTRLLVQISRWKRKGSQLKQTSYHRLILIVHLCVLAFTYTS